MKKTMKYAIIIVLLLIAILIAMYNIAGYVPIVGKTIANKQIEQYRWGIYNVIVAENSKYSFYSGRYETQRISYALNTNYIWDTHQIDKWNEQLSSDFENIKTQMPKNITLKSADISGFIDANDYSTKIQRLYLPIYNDAHLSIGESEKKAAEITKLIIDQLGDKYSIAGVQVWYFDKNGGYTIEKMEDTSEIITYDWLLENTQKIDKIGEEEQKWISELQ